MAYEISGFIAPQATFAAYRELSDRVVVAMLPQGFELLLNDRYLERALGIMPACPEADIGQYRLCRDLLGVLLERSKQQAVAYVEAEFFGGIGEQYAVLWKDGQEVLRPPTNGLLLGGYNAVIPSTETPINAVLHELGVKRDANNDEFDALGLGTHRHMQDWFAHFTRYEPQDYRPDHHLG